MQNLARLACSAAAAAIVGPLAASRARANLVAEDDRRLITMTQDFRTRYGRASGYLARLRGAAAPRSSILVVHDHAGLTPHVRDVARRLALLGYVALAPDFLSTSPDGPGDDDDRTALAIATAGVEFLMASRDTTNRVGAVGFSWGGGLVNRLAAESRDIAAAISFYGEPPDARLARRIRAPLLLHYGDPDEEENAEIQEFLATLDAAGTGYAVHFYEGVGHGFFNDAAEELYDADAAELAWNRTAEFFAATLQ